MAGPPGVNINTPADGDWFTDYNVTMTGNTTNNTEPLKTVTINASELGPGTQNCTVTENQIVFRPYKVFHDDFDGDSVNSSKWDVTDASGLITVADGVLTMSEKRIVNDYYYPLMNSKNRPFPKDFDWMFEYRISWNKTGSQRSGCALTDEDGFNSFDCIVTAQASRSFYGIRVGGQWLLGPSEPDEEWHTHAIAYSHSTGLYQFYDDGSKVATPSARPADESIWILIGKVTSFQQTYAPLHMDYTTITSAEGVWVSDPVDMGERRVIEAAEPLYGLSHPSMTSFTSWMSISEDGVDWSKWTELDNGRLARPLKGTYARFKVRWSTPPDWEHEYNVTLDGFNITYWNPPDHVMVRRQGGEWHNATGAEEWSAGVQLAEDENVIEARAFDTSGEFCTTSVRVIADTTPPVGTISLNDGAEMTNDKNITITCTATDRYGLAEVLVSKTPDVGEARRFPYNGTVHFPMPNLEGEGTALTLYAWFVDTHGLVSGMVSDDIMFDTVPPSAAITIDDGAEYTTTGVVDLDLTYHDGTGVSRVEISLSPDFSDPVEVDVGTDSVELDLGATEDGPVMVYMQVFDQAGNSATANDTIKVFFPKVIGSVVIHDEPEVTNLPIVMLEIDTPIEFRVKTMQISGDPAFEGVEWMTYEEEKLWSLSEGDGPKTIYVRFMDFRGIVSLPINASTVLDGTIPTVSLTIMGGLEYTVKSDLQVAVTYTDASPATRMWLSTDGEFDREEPEPFKQTFVWTIPAVEGLKTLYLMVEDLAGNLGVAEASIHYASIEPVVWATLVGGSPVGDAGEVRVALEYVDHYGEVVVQVALDTPPSDGQEWTDCVEPLVVTIPAGTQEGTHLVYFRGMNEPGLVSEVDSLEFELDLTAPAVTIDTPADGKKVSQKGHVITLSLTAEDASVIATARYRMDGGSWIEIDHISTLETEVDLGSYGEHTIEVEVVDTAGNAGTSSATFKLEKEEESPSVGILGAMAAIGLLAFIGRRRGRG